MAFLGGLFGGSHRQSPQDAANQYLNQIPSLAHQYADPRIQQGQEATAGLPGFYHDLMNNPAEQLNKAMDAYNPSKEYNFKYEQMMRQARNAAAAGGFKGTPFDTSQQQALAHGLADADIQKWYQNYSNAQNAGLSGLQGLGNRGDSAAAELFNVESGGLQNQADLAANQAAINNANHAKLMERILGIGGDVLGGIVGGPIGAKAGEWAGNKLSNWWNGGAQGAADIGARQLGSGPVSNYAGTGGGGWQMPSYTMGGYGAGNGVDPYGSANQMQQTPGFYGLQY